MADRLSPELLLALQALASYRLWRLVAKDDLTAALRERIPDGWLTDAIACPWCSGAWSSAGVVAVLAWHIGLPLPVLQWAAVSTFVGLLDRILTDG